MTGTTIRSLGLAALVALAAAGCGSSAGSASASPERSSRGALLTVAGTKYGRAIADRKGEALYLFTADGRGPSKCYGACAKAWPPLLTRGKPQVGRGLKASAVGTRRRSDGKLQVTYKGQPLYYFVGDAPGNILCQNVNEYGGDWLIVLPSGAPNRAPR
jgi:predicted lipoprotein with Yx(FWY)xxD motif